MRIYKRCTNYLQIRQKLDEMCAQIEIAWFWSIFGANLCICYFFKINLNENCIEITSHVTIFHENTGNGKLNAERISVFYQIAILLILFADKYDTVFIQMIVFHSIMFFPILSPTHIIILKANGAETEPLFQQNKLISNQF